MQLKAIYFLSKQKGEKKMLGLGMIGEMNKNAYLTCTNKINKNDKATPKRAKSFYK